MEIRLSEGGGREYLAGSGKGKYSIADVKAWPWYVSLRDFVGNYTRELICFV